MTDFHRLSPDMLASPQIEPGDLGKARSEGVTLVVNNRPDGEDPDAPQSAEIEKAARELDLAYLYLPVTHSGISAAQIDTLAESLAKADGKTLAYCRSGTRSTMLWALARVKGGAAPDDISRAAAEAGYDLSPIRPMMDMLATR
ncbi:MAG: TIGR01244 family sulfur transferase [Erythrobacter sp.]